MEEHFLVLEVYSFSTAHLATGLFASSAGQQLLDWIISLQDRSLDKALFATLFPFASPLS